MLGKEKGEMEGGAYCSKSDIIVVTEKGHWERSSREGKWEGLTASNIRGGRDRGWGSKLQIMWEGWGD